MRFVFKINLITFVCFFFRNDPGRRYDTHYRLWIIVQRPITRNILSLID